MRSLSNGNHQYVLACVLQMFRTGGGGDLVHEEAVMAEIEVSHNPPHDQHVFDSILILCRVTASTIHLNNSKASWKDFDSVTRYAILPGRHPYTGPLFCAHPHTRSNPVHTSAECQDQYQSSALGAPTAPGKSHCIYSGENVK